MDTKGQIQQVFIYILAIIIVGMVILLGYKSINGMIKKSCEVEKTNFQTDLRTMLDRYDDYGSTNVKELDSPCGYYRICFVDAEQLGNSEFTHDNSIVANSVKENVSQNIFMMKKSITEPVGFSEKIKVNNKVVCIDSKSNHFNIRFDGLGKKVLISEGN